MKKKNQKKNINKYKNKVVLINYRKIVIKILKEKKEKKEKKKKMNNKKSIIKS